MSTITKDLGAVTAYAYAKEKGYTGTEAEYAELMASYATVAEQASQSAQTASEKASEASQSASDAESAKTASETAQGIAESARDEAESARDTAQQNATAATTKAQEASQSAQTAITKASEASQSASDAQTAKTASQTAQGIAETARDEAESARDAAQQSAQTATEKAQQASASATSASQSADTASASATSASQSAQTATTKASEASASASTAGTKASEASTSATTASSKASEASASATSAQTAQGLAESARDDAIDAKTDAETARDMAQQYAESINPENIFSAYPADTASGSVATFADGADDIPLKSCVVAIEPVQSGSGDPSPDNVRPISGWTGAQVVRAGKNLLPVLNPSTTSNGITFTVNDDGSITVNGTATSQANFFCVSSPIGGLENGKTYFLSGCPNGGGIDSYALWLNNGGTGQDNGSGASIVYNKHEVVGRIRVASGTVCNNLVFRPQLELGSTATDYEPYHADTYDITFPAEAGTVYGGTLDVTTGELVVDRAMVDLGQYNWTVNNHATLGTYFFANIPISMIKYRGDFGVVTYPILTPLYKASRRTPTLFLNNCICFDGNNNGKQVTQIQIKDARYSNANEFNTAIQGVMLCYELATPITISLSPTEIKSLLGDNNVWADSGDTEVEYRANTTLYINKKIAEAVSALS